MDLRRATDMELVEAARRSPSRRDEYLDRLYRRYYAKVAHWCRRISGDPQQAADLAQEVFLRVHDRIDSFRMESSFSTWLYTVMRSVTINRGMREQRRETHLDRTVDLDPRDTGPGPDSVAARREQLEQVRRVMQSELDSREARVLYLHYVQGLTLAAITELMSLENKSGAKAYVVSGLRKLKGYLRADGKQGTKPMRVENE